MRRVRLRPRALPPRDAALLMLRGAPGVTRVHKEVKGLLKTRLQGSFELPGVLSSRNAITASAASGSLALLHPGGDRCVTDRRVLQPCLDAQLRDLGKQRQAMRLPARSQRRLTTNPAHSPRAMKRA